MDRKHQQSVNPLLSIVTAATILLSTVVPSCAQNEPQLWWQHTCTLADQDSEHGNYDAAIKKLEPLVRKLGETDRDNIEIVYPLVNLANLYAWTNRRDDAEKAGKRAIEIAEVNPPHTANLSKAGYNQAQILAGCKKMYRFALEGLANSYLNEERYIEAEKVLNKSLTKLGTSDDSVVSQALLADVLKQKQEYKKAAESYKKVIAIRERLKDPEELAKSYESLGNCYYLQDNLPAAETVLLKALDIMAKATLSARPVNSDFHYQLGNVYYYQKRYPDAEKEYRAAVAILTADPEANDERKAERLRDLGSVLVVLGKLDEAEQCYNTALKDNKFQITKDIFLDNLLLLQNKTCFATYKKYFKATDIHLCIAENQKKIEPNSIAYAKFLEDICVSFQAFPVRNEPVIPMLKQAIAIRTKLAGPVSPEIAHDQYLMAFRLASLGGEFAQPALDSYKTWKELNKVGSTKLKTWQFAMTRLAYLLGAAGKDHRTEALEIADIAYDTESKGGAELYDLATLFELFGKFGKARVIYDESFEFAKSRHNVLNMATAALSRASLSFRERDMTSAWSEAKQAESLFIEAQGPEYYKNSPFNLSCIQLLTDLCVERGELSAAESYARQLTSPLKWRPSAAQIQRDYLELAKILLLETKTAEATKIIETAVTTLSNSTYRNYLGEIELARAHDMLGDIAIASKKYSDADMHFRRAYNLYRDDDTATSGILGMVNDLNQLAKCAAASGGQSAQAVQLACLKLDRYLKSVFPQISFAQQCAFVTCIGDQIDPLLTYASNNDSASKTFQYLMQWQGLLVDSVRRSSGDSAGDAATLNQLRKIRNQLSKSSTQSADASAVAALTLEKEALERKLALRRKADDKADTVLQKTSKEFINMLTDDEAFLDIVHYHRFDDGSPAYAAFVVTKSSGVKVVSLSNAVLIDDAVSKWVQSMATPGGSVRDLKFDTAATANTPTESPAVLCAAVSDKLWTPLKTAIPANVRKVWLCPDSKLSTLPWSVLLENAHAENLLLTQVDSPRAFISLKESLTRVAQNTQNNVLLVGGINFANKALFLPGTKQEVSEIEGLVKNQGYQLTELTGGAATKAALLENLGKSSFAHIATHGFFNQTTTTLASASSGVSTAGSASAGSASAAGIGTGTGTPGSSQKRVSREIASASSGEVSNNSFLMERDPLLSSGLLVAPASDGTSSSTNNDADDHLTAEELVGQDLSGCRTVVLSACNTGRGKGYDGQGVMGLRAALIGAGVKGVVMSLWPVDDDATRELMKQFYLNLWSKTNPMPPAMALRTAQQAVRNNPSGQWKHPFYWAGWIYDGLGW